MKRTVTILAIESSCDESGVALVHASRKRDHYTFEVKKNFVYSQISTHRKHGGVVPEVAAREHAVRLPRLLDELASTKATKAKLKKSIDAVAVTSGPGLITSLLVGVEFAKTISAVWKKPLVAVNHLEGHIYANLLTRLKTEHPQFVFPVLALIVSGAHTELVLMKSHLHYKLLGSTRDDAVGEAFDKTAKLLGLPYPGGPVLSKLAQKGNVNAVNFPRAMLDQKNFDFSFSGLKTAVAIHLQKNKTKPADVAASFEEAATDALIHKTLRAAAQYKPKTVLIAGGVAANLPLRRKLNDSFTAAFPHVHVLEPDLLYTTDNAAMIGAAGAVRFLNGYTTPWNKVIVDPRPRLA